jgi:hypothetical protein
MNQVSKYGLIEKPKVKNLMMLSFYEPIMGGGEGKGATKL